MAALRVFVHTDADAVQVVAVPALLDPASYTRTLQAGPLARLSLTRAQVQAAVQRELGVPDLAGLVGGLTPDSWSDAARRGMYADAGAPGVEAFAAALGLAWD